MPAADAFAAWDLECAVEENAPLSTTGGHVWGAARTVARFLALDAADAAARGEEWRYARKLGEGARVVELGAGCGWLAVTIAHNCEASRVVATERASGGGLAHLERNIAANTSAKRTDGRAPLTLGAVHAAECDWTTCGGAPTLALRACTPAAAGAVEAESDDVGKSTAAHEAFEATGETIQAGSWDLVLGSDLVYDSAGTEALPRLLGGICRAARSQAAQGKGIDGDGCVVLYGHTKRRYETYDHEFYDALAAEGLVVSEVRCVADGPRPESPPPLMERLESSDVDALFPEQVRARDVGKGARAYACMISTRLLCARSNPRAHTRARRESPCWKCASHARAKKSLATGSAIVSVRLCTLHVRLRILDLPAESCALAWARTWCSVASAILC